MKSNMLGWIALGLLVGPMAALAAPPFTHDTNRNAARSLSVGDCDGERCLSLQAAETYDLKGDYQYSFLSLTETLTSNGVVSQRYLSCPLERGLISVRQDAGSASLQTSVNAADCDTGGTLCDSEYNCVDWGYTGTISVSVAMSAPFGTFSETSHVQARDGSDTYAAICKRNAGYSYSNVSVAIDGEPWSPESSGAGDEYCNRHNRER